MGSELTFGAWDFDDFFDKNGFLYFADFLDEDRFFYFLDNLDLFFDKYRNFLYDLSKLDDGFDVFQLLLHC